MKRPAEIFLYGIYVVVFNNITHQYVKANVSVSNGHGYYVTGQTTNGIFWTPTNMTGGRSTHRCRFPVRPKSQEIYVPRRRGRQVHRLLQPLEDTSTKDSNGEVPHNQGGRHRHHSGFDVPGRVLVPARPREEAHRAESKKKDHAAKQKKKTGGKTQKLFDTVWKKTWSTSATPPPPWPSRRSACSRPLGARSIPGGWCSS